jgi:hypothetical protein
MDNKAIVVTIDDGESPSHSYTIVSLEADNIAAVVEMPSKSVFVVLKVAANPNWQVIRVRETHAALLIALGWDIAYQT